jgi:hypothetical protein
MATGASMEASIDRPGNLRRRPGEWLKLHLSRDSRQNSMNHCV